MALAMSFTSCVREDLDQCPPLRINIEVKDKNYFNVDQTVPDEKRDENQSFRSFVPSLSYRLSRLNDDGTQQVIVEEKGFGVEGDGLTYPVSFDPDMPFGKYVFTVWGGMKTQGELNLDKNELLLHPEHSQGDDVYQVCDTLVYDENHYCYTSEMERTKGKLVIWTENLPAGYHLMNTEVSDLYGIVNPSFQYSEETSVFHESEIKAGAKTLRLVVRGKNDKLTFNNFNSSFTAAGATGSTIKYCVNGSTSTGAALTTDAKFKDGSNGYVLYSINLDDWYKNGDTNHDGLLTEEDGWTHADIFKKTTLVKGSVFGSNFVIPFALTHEKSTMELQLLDAAGDIIKTWTVSIPAKDVNRDATNGNVADESASIFNVVRNHMYNLGVKPSNGGKTDPDPGNPDPDPKPDPDPDKPDPDKPEDLSKSQNLILKVNDNWEAIHQMELGD